MRANPTCRVRNMTPEYTAFYEDPDLGDTLTPGTPQWEYYHFTKRFGYLGVATSCEMRENRFCLYVSDQEIARARKILEQRVSPNPSGTKTIRTKIITRECRFSLCFSIS